MMKQELAAARSESGPRMIEEVLPGQIYRHFKGHIVRVIAVSTGSEDGSIVVVYKHLGSRQVWHRPMDNFLSEVDRKRYPEAEQKYRFELIKGKKANKWQEKSKNG